jgi:hypothetical protein
MGTPMFERRPMVRQAHHKFIVKQRKSIKKLENRILDSPYNFLFDAKGPILRISTKLKISFVFFKFCL